MCLPTPLSSLCLSTQTLNSQNAPVYPSVRSVRFQTLLRRRLPFPPFLPPPRQSELRAPGASARRGPLARYLTERGGGRGEGEEREGGVYVLIGYLLNSEWSWCVWE